MDNFVEMNIWLNEFLCNIIMHNVDGVISKLRQVNAPAVRDLEGNTALHYVSKHAMCGSDRIVRYLIDHHCDVNAKNIDGVPPLEDAISNCNVHVAKLLLDAGAIRDGWYFNEGRGPLLIAAECGNLWAVQMLLQEGFDPQAVDEHGFTALHCAAMRSIDDKDVMEALIDAGIDVNSRCQKGRTPLHYAATDTAIEVLLRRGADVHALSNSGKTPLQYVINYQNMTAIKPLIEAGCNVNWIDEKGRNVLHYASKHFDIYISMMLMELGARVNVVDRDGLDPLCYGLKNIPKFYPHVRMFGLEQDDCDQCIWNHDFDLIMDVVNYMRIFFKNGAKVNRSDFSVSPLYITLANFPHSIVVEFLLSQGAVFSFTDEIIRKVMKKCKAKTIPELFISYAAIFHASNRNDGPRNFVTSDFNEKQMEYYGKCMDELDRMKKWDGAEDEESIFFKVLTRKVISRYARDSDVIDALNNHHQILRDFPIYGSRLIKRFSEEKKKQTLKSGALEGLGRLFNVNHDALHVIFDRDVHFLKDEDMHALSKI